MVVLWTNDPNVSLLTPGVATTDRYMSPYN